jgi:hypothetical protein
MSRDAKISRLSEAKRADDRQLVTSQAQTFRLRPGLLAAGVGHSRRRVPATPREKRESAAIGDGVGRAVRYFARVLEWVRRGQGGKGGADPGAVGWISFGRHTAWPTPQDGRSGQTYLFDAPVADNPHTCTSTTSFHPCGHRRGGGSARSI